MAIGGGGVGGGVGAGSGEAEVGWWAQTQLRSRLQQVAGACRVSDGGASQHMGWGGGGWVVGGGGMGVGAGDGKEEEDDGMVVPSEDAGGGDFNGEGGSDSLLALVLRQVV